MLPVMRDAPASGDPTMTFTQHATNRTRKRSVCAVLALLAGLGLALGGCMTTESVAPKPHAATAARAQVPGPILGTGY
jgi:hypothetical protein